MAVWQGAVSRPRGSDFLPATEPAAESPMRSLGKLHFAGVAGQDGPDLWPGARLAGVGMDGFCRFNRCAECFGREVSTWGAGNVHDGLARKLLRRDSPVPLFVVFRFPLQFPMLTGPGASILRGMCRV